MKLLLLFFLGVSFGQNISINDKDEFTKNHIIQVNCSKNKNWSTTDNILKGLFNNGFLSVKNIKSQENNLNILQLNTQLGFSYCTSNFRSKIIILFSDESTLELNNTNELLCGNTVVNTYNFTIEDLNIMINKNFKKIRIYTTDSYLDIEIKEKSIDMIKNTFLLYKNTIQK
jgi:hypothetical protein